MKKNTIIALSSIIVIAAATTTYFLTRKKTVALNIVTAKADFGYITKSVTATGTIQPVDTVSVGAQVSGVVKSIFADFNSVVKKGQLLAKIDPSIINAQVEQSKASVATAQSNLVFQQSNYSRQSQLFKLGAISQSDYQIALNLKNNAVASVDNALSQLKISNQNLYYTNIYSPIDGVILNRNVSEGQTIASSFNAPVLFVIAKDLTKMQVRAAVDEADIGGVKSAQNATFTVDAFPDFSFQGVVDEILLHASISANVVTYATLINVDNKDLKLKPGMTASIKIYTEEDSNVLLIPSKALTFKPDFVLLKNYKIVGHEHRQGSGIMNQVSVARIADSSKLIAKYIWVKTGDTLTERAITIGLNDDSFVNVTSGLLQYEDVITGVVNATVQNKTDAVANKSPFMPQMQRRGK